MDGGDEISQIKKRKRTRRQKSSSPLTNAVTSTSSSSNGCGRESSSSMISDSPGAATDCAEEEEDDMVATCLMMLAHGSGSPFPKKPIHKKKSEINNPNNLFQCKTCNRTFASFQALGGHRASHKKPKITAAAEEEKPKATDEGQNGQFSIITNNAVNKVNKIHECSICGSEFNSGQALGGHMRRHRAVAAAAAAAAAGGERSNTDQMQTSPGNNDGQRKYLPLDLNLPAPEEDLRETKFQAGIVFSAPALVDCHY